MALARRTFNRLLALAGLACAGCGTRDEGKPAGAPAPAASTRPGSLRYLALGDSYTIGESVAPEQRWPVQLARALRQRGIDVADPHIIARTGWRTDDLDAAITSTNPQGPYHLVSLLIGVNDQYQGRSEDEYRRQFPAMLQRAMDLAGGDASRVIMLSIPDWGVTPFAEGSDRQSIARQIDAFNAINRSAAEKSGARYVDVTAVSRLAPQQPDLIAADGLHPSGKMYEEWVKLALPQAITALEPSAASQPSSTRRS